jgi:transcriptional regulator with XRE-family HTH domain
MIKKQQPFAEFLQTAMVAAGVPRAADLHRATGLGEPNIGRWLSGRQPGIETLRRLSPILGVPVVQLLVAAGHLTADEAGMNEAPIVPPVADPDFDALRWQVARSGLDEATKEDLDADLLFCQRKWDRIGKMLADNP